MRTHPRDASCAKGEEDRVHDSLRRGVTLGKTALKARPTVSTHMKARRSSAARESARMRMKPIPRRGSRSYAGRASGQKPWEA